MVILGSRLAAGAPVAPSTRMNGFASRHETSIQLNGSSPSSERCHTTAVQSPLEEIEALGKRCRKGDLDAWTLLFPKVWPVLVTFIHRLYHSFEQQDAEDVAQTSLEAAISAIHTFSGTGLFRAWLFGIAVRQAATFYRASAAKKRGAGLLVRLTSVEDASDESKSPAEVVAENERAVILHRAINQLPEVDRDLIHLHYFGELTFQEIAEVRKMNPKTVCTRLTRCKERLLVALARFDLTKSDG